MLFLPEVLEKKNFHHALVENVFWANQYQRLLILKVMIHLRNTLIKHFTSSCLEVFYKKGVLRNFAKINRKIFLPESLL